MDSDSDWEETGDEWAVPDAVATSLFGDFTGPVDDVFKHMVEHHGLDFHGLRKKLQLDQYGCIRLINFIRSKVAADPATATGSFAAPAPSEFAGDEYFKPVLENDALLQHDYEYTDPAEVVAMGAEAVLASKCAALEDQLVQMKEEFALFRQSTESALLGGMTAADLRSDGEQQAALAKEKAAEKEENDPEDVESYFIGYAHYGIHEEMLKDKVRTETYRDSMYNNKDFFKGKVVLDVGCGSGILSMCAARAGAARVIAVDNSSVLKTAAKIIEENGLQDVITLVRGKIEEVTLPVEKVDIIISEWMGYFLLFESMLDSVMFARDKWLVPGGVVLPDKCKMFLTALIDPDRTASRVDYWNDVYGFKMESLREHLYPEPDVTIINPAAMASAPVGIKDINVNADKVESVQTVAAPFRLKMEKAGKCDALSVHFDIWFDAGMPSPVFFSTGPDATPTHWKQTLFYLETAMMVEVGDVIEGSISASQCVGDERHWDIVLEYKCGSSMELCTQKYRI